MKALVVVLALAIGRLARAVSEMKRLLYRVEALGDLPVLKGIERAEADGRRIDASLAQLPAPEMVAAGTRIVKIASRVGFKPGLIGGH